MEKERGKAGPKGPWRFTPDRTAEIIEAMEAYCQATSVPILVEFAYNFGMYSVKPFYEVPALIEARERFIMRKAAQLEKGGLAEQVNATMAIFLLKQIGYSDRIEATIESTDLTKGLTHAQKKARIEEIIARRAGL